MSTRHRLALLFLSIAACLPHGAKAQTRLEQGTAPHAAHSEFSGF